MDSSANGLTPSRSIAKRAAAAIDASDTAVPDSFAISIPIDASPPPATVAAIGHRAGPGALLDSLPPRAGVHDVGDQPVANHVGAGQLCEVHIIHTIEDVL